MSVERAVHVLLPLKGSPVTAYPLDKVSLKFILFTDISMATDLLKLSPLPMQTLFAWVSQTLNAGVSSAYFVGTLFSKSLPLNWTLLSILICV